MMWCVVTVPLLEVWGRVLPALHREACCAARPCIAALSASLLPVSPARHPTLGTWLSLADPALAPHCLLPPCSPPFPSSPPQALLFQHSALVPPSPNLALGVRIASCDMVNNSPLPYCKNMLFLFLYIFFLLLLLYMWIFLYQNVIICIAQESRNKLHLYLKIGGFVQFFVINWIKAKPKTFNVLHLRVVVLNNVSNLL